jgi:hypothetical protein
MVVAGNAALLVERRRTKSAADAAFSSSLGGSVCQISLGPQSSQSLPLPQVGGRNTQKKHRKYDFRQIARVALAPFTVTGNPKYDESQ